MYGYSPDPEEVLDQKTANEIQTRLQVKYQKRTERNTCFKETEVQEKRPPLGDIKSKMIIHFFGCDKQMESSMQIPSQLSSWNQKRKMDLHSL